MNSERVKECQPWKSRGGLGQVHTGPVWSRSAPVPCASSLSHTAFVAAGEPQLNVVVTFEASGMDTRMSAGTKRQGRFCEGAEGMDEDGGELGGEWGWHGEHGWEI